MQWENDIENTNEKSIGNERHWSTQELCSGQGDGGQGGEGRRVSKGNKIPNVTDHRHQ